MTASELCHHVVRVPFPLRLNHVPLGGGTSLCSSFIPPGALGGSHTSADVIYTAGNSGVQVAAVQDPASRFWGANPEAELLGHMSPPATPPPWPAKGGELPGPAAGPLRAGLHTGGSGQVLPGQHPSAHSPRTKGKAL